MMRRIFSFFLAAILLTGCASSEKTTEKKQYKATFLTLFDTVTTIVGYENTEAEFGETAQELHDNLLEYHQLFDAYNNYEGMNNIKTINDQAGMAPVKVDRKIIDLLLDCKEFYSETNGKVNVTMGSVLNLWHETRSEGIDDPESARIPEIELLKNASDHCSFDTVLIDEDSSTVFVTDPLQRLDVGAVAKGWALQRVCENAPSGILISVGGNVCATGPKPLKDNRWVVGIQSPDEEQGKYMHTVYIRDGCVVTSGDYQRYYTVDGKRYHHIIDPDTLYPSEYWRSVTIISDDSGVSDVLSTALFIMSREDGQKLLDTYGAYAMWVAPKGDVYYSPGFEEIIRT